MYGTNSKGRTIHRGLRGGFYVIDSKGKKIYKKIKGGILPVVPPPPPTSSPGSVNNKGRKIRKGPRGGFYVLDDKGKKVYKFKRRTPAPAPAPAPAPPPAPARPKSLQTKVKQKLLNILRNVRKRRTSPKTNNFATKTVKRHFRKFVSIDPETKGRLNTKEVDISIRVPDGPSQLGDLIKNGTILGVTEDTLPMQEWLDAQSRYLSSLSKEDLFTAMSYTVRSHQWIGPWIRGEKYMISFTKPHNFTAPLYSQIMKLARTPQYTNEQWAQMLLLTPDNQRFATYINMLGYSGMYFPNKIPKKIIDEAMQMYIKDLQRIIKHAPPLPKTIYVYRGLSRNILANKIGTKHVFGEFSSAGYVPQRVYAGNNYMRMKLLKGVRVLLLQGLNHWNKTGEYEILINKDSHYVVTKRYLDRYAYNEERVANWVWYRRKNKVTDVTVYN